MTEKRDAPGRETQRGRIGLAAIAFVLAVLALLAPLAAGTAPEARVGILLVLAAVLEFAHGFRRASATGRRAAWAGGAVTMAMGVLLVHASWLAAAALILFIAGSFAFDGVRYLVDAVSRPRHGEASWSWLLPALGNLTVAALLLVLRGQAMAWTVAVAGALRILGTAWNILLAPVFTADDSAETVLDDLGLADHPELAALGARLEAEEVARVPIDRGWILAFVATLFAIHIGRMGFDRTFLGVVSPGFAVLGDMVVALLLAFAVAVPARLLLRRLTRGLERQLWSWCLAVPAVERGWARRTVQAGLTSRLRFSLRVRAARYSFRAALSRGLQIGLPLAAIVAATVPVWGMSWYFDTENWTASIWNSWAEERTDTWREAMVRPVAAREAGAGPARAFAVNSPGVDGGRDFAFVVIGDTGEGDASQHVLRDQLLAVVGQDDVRFVVVSSDVIYPTGAMKDYEAKFWLPFKGTRKPVYAIPGNHDWYDALEGFTATFLTPDAARAAMRARIEVDRRITSTTEGRIEDLVRWAARLRHEYEVPTQGQRAPFFQVQTEHFALVAVDTGVAKRVDATQLAWLRAALGAARGKLTMVVLGHPFYAGGEYRVGLNEDFLAVHRVLREHDVAIVMAGDTHDLEYYADRYEGPSGARTAHHFVNGGGGAYLSFGTALAWPARPATRDWAFYPATAQVVSKIDAETPRWKWPAWWWTKRFGAWPFSAEWLSAAFDSNVAPFYQSFIEVRVEPSVGRVRLLPYGVHGRLRWSDLQASAGARPAGAAPDSLVEWVVEMPR